MNRAVIRERIWQTGNCV